MKTWWRRRRELFVDWFLALVGPSQEDLRRVVVEALREEVHELRTAASAPVSPQVWIVEFDWRSDGGQRRVGPFASRDAAGEWLAGLVCDYNASVVPVQRPGKVG